MHFQVNHLFSSLLNKNIITARVKKITDILGVSDYQFSVVIEDNKKITDLNRQFRGINEPTDVLAFPSNIVDQETGQKYLGDIIISSPIAQKQAEAYGNTLNDEILTLITHGILHLLGHDHIVEDDRQKMFSIQKEVLLKVGIVFNE